MFSRSVSKALKKKNKQKANHNHNHPRHNNDDRYQLCMNNNSYCKYLFNERLLLKNPISNNNDFHISDILR